MNSSITPLTSILEIAPNELSVIAFSTFYSRVGCEPRSANVNRSPCEHVCEPNIRSPNASVNANLTARRWREHERDREQGTTCTLEQHEHKHETEREREHAQQCMQQKNLADITEHRIHSQVWHWLTLNLTKMLVALTSLPDQRFWEPKLNTQSSRRLRSSLLLESRPGQWPHTDRTKRCWPRTTFSEHEHVQVWLLSCCELY